MLICYVASNDYDVAACTCPHGQQWRVPWQLKAWAKRQLPPPVRVLRLEEIYTAKALTELQTEDGPGISEMFA